MIRQITLIVSLHLATLCASGQISQPPDTSHMQIRRGATTYFIDGFRVYSKITKSDSLKILKETATKLNGYWKSKSNSVMARFIISNKTLSGQMLLPYDKVQQAPPIAIKLAFNEMGTVILITPANTLRLNIIDDELTLEENTFYKYKK